MWGGPMAFEWKKKPVALVAMVVARKIAVQGPGRRSRTSPAAAARPLTIASRLMATWSAVKAPVESPRIIIPPALNGLRWRKVYPRSRAR